MSRFKLGRPSPALVIACIALFVAMGGVGYAAATGSIDGREIKNSSVTGKDVKNSALTGSDVKANSLKGTDIAESSLGKVASAGQADNAATAGSATTAKSAGNANTVGGNGVRAFSRAIAQNTLTLVAIASARGFTLLAACDAAGNPKLSVDTTRDNARVHYDHVNFSGVHTRARNENVDASLPPLAIDGGQDDGVGTVTVGTTDGNALTVTMSFGDADAFDQAACAFVGSAIG